MNGMLPCNWCGQAHKHLLSDCVTRLWVDCERLRAEVARLRSALALSSEDEVGR